jgi:hypothetical protein
MDEKVRRLSLYDLTASNRTGRKAMSKTARGCRCVRVRPAPKQHPAILPWLSSLLVTGTPIESGICRQHIAAGPQAADANKRHPPEHAREWFPAQMDQRRMPSFSIKFL